MGKIRFIHAADLHLDSPFQGLKAIPKSLFNRVKESTFDALERLVNHAINENVDFIILAGDLFDGENRSFKAQSKLKKAMEKLYAHKISCYIIHGNHDHLKGNWIPLSWPENVFFFKDEIDFVEFKKAEVAVHLYGFSYPEKSVKENIASKYKKNGTADFHIGILHGTAEGQEGHDPYAPFSIKQLLEKDFDYWALGHIHKRQILHKEPYITYPGNTQGRHKKELGEKGVFLVELDTMLGSSITFLPTSTIYWEELVVSIDGMNKIDELKMRCEEILYEARKSHFGLFVILRFVGTGSFHNYLHEYGDEFIEVLNSDQEKKTSFTYVIDKKLDTIGDWNRENLKKEQHLIRDIITVADRITEVKVPLNEIVDEISNNQKIRQYVSSFSEEEQTQILKEAENYILSELLKEKEE